MKNKFLLIILIIIFFLVALNYLKAKNPSCTNPFEVRDYTSTKNESIKVCGDSIRRGNITVVKKKDFSDLFESNIIKTSPHTPTLQFVRVFSKENQDYVSVISNINWITWSLDAIGVYRKENGTYKLIFKKPFDDLAGRWVKIGFLSNFETEDHMGIYITGDVGFLGCYGCRMNWTDYYNWDSKQKTYLLANNKHREEFQKLFEEYEKIDKEACGKEDPLLIGMSISELYPTRKDKIGFCFDKAKAPFITVSEAERFLQTKQTIQKIIEGENIPMNKINTIKF